jgi:hypothetical protein
VIVFACAVGEAEPYARYAEPGIRRVAEPDSEVVAFAAVDPVSRTYNLLLEAAASHRDLEALVLVHPHTELLESEFCATVRQALADPQVAILGAVGASGVSSLAWWEGSVSCGPLVHRYSELGGGELPAFAWADPGPAPARVDVVEESLLVLSPWAVRNLRFDEGLVLGYGFDVDFCLQAREQGRSVMTVPVPLVTHRDLDLVSDPELWAQAHQMLAAKWEGRWPAQAAAGDWKERARRAEAELEAARALAFFQRLGYEAQVKVAERRLRDITETRSWRITLPLRRANAARRERAATNQSPQFSK